MNFKFKSKKFIVGTLLSACCVLGAGVASAYQLEVNWRYYDQYGYVVGGGSSDCDGNLTSFGVTTSTVTSTIKACR
ncbi:MAG: hypothetical protein HRT35_29865 [Algicola sp.]|nr:hypothetical protein [Algicola sp.]